MHKHQIRSFFTSEIKDEILADHIYLLFEGTIMMGRIYRNNELTLRSKTIVNKLLKEIKLIIFLACSFLLQYHRSCLTSKMAIVLPLPAKKTH